MKKRLLTVATVCSLWNILYAQTDVTGKYLVNPSFETLKAKDGTTDVNVKETLSRGLYGWELVEMSNYQVESYESGSATGFPADGSGKINPTDGTYYYFNRQGWAHNSGEVKTTSAVELEPGIYYVVADYKAADYSNNGNSNANGTTIGIKVTDASQNILGENKAVRRAYSISNWGSNPGSDTYMVNAEWNELGTMFTVEQATKVTVAFVQNMVNSGRSDIAYDNLRLYKVENVDKDSPMDITGIITNSNNYQLAGWGITGGDTFHVNTWSSEGNSDGSNMVTPFLENWVSSGNMLKDAVISHKLTGLAPGFYKATVHVRTLNEAGGETPSGANVFINSAEASVCNGSPCNRGTYGTYTVEGVVNLDGILEVGIKIKDANFNWIAFKDFKLEYKGTEGFETVLQTQYDELRTELNSMATIAPSEGLKGIIDSVIKETEGASTIEDLSSAITMMQNTKSECESLIERYNEVSAVISEHELLLSSSVSSQGGAEDNYRNAIEQSLDKLNAAISLDAYNEIVTELSAVRLEYIKYAEPKEGQSLDFTFLVGNPTCTVNEPEGSRSWTRNSKNVSANYVVNTPDLASAVYSGGGVEEWTSAGIQNEDLIWQNLSNLPQGAYEIVAYATGRNQSNNNMNEGSLQLFANEGTAKVSSNTWTEVKTAGLVDESGELKIGLKGGIDNKNNWVAIANVRLNYIGNDLLGYYQQLFASKNEEAKQLADKLQSDISPVLSGKLMAGVDGSEFGDDFEKYSQGADSLQTLIDAAYSTTESYKAFVTFKNEVVNISQNSLPKEEDDRLRLNLSLTELTKEVEQAMTSAIIDEAYSSLEKARQTYVLDASPVGNMEFDMTFLIKNPNVDGIPAFSSLKSIGWNSDLLSGNKQTNNTNNASGNSEFVEAWIPNAPMSSVFAVYQNVYLPEGIYRLTADAFANGNNARIAANDFDGSYVTSNNAANMSQVELEAFANVQPGYVKLGLKLEKGNTTNWLGMNNMRLYKKAVAETAVLTENDVNETLLPGIYNQIDLQRTYNGTDDWDILCVPFDMSSAQIDEYFDEVRSFKSIEKTSDDEVTLTLSETVSMFAGVPYLVKAKQSGESTMSLYNMTVANTEPKTLLFVDENNEVTMNIGFGTYTYNQNVPENAFVLDNNSFVNTDVTELPAFRAYVTLDSDNISRVVLKDEVQTSVDKVSLDSEIVDVYSITGVLVRGKVEKSKALDGLQSGIYIVGNKKVVKK